jgi:predicted CxxxxCH...CXXCH cytochrome family protein
MVGKRENCKFYSHKVAGIIVLAGLTLNAGTGHSASVLNSCTTYCHALPPRDGIRKGNPHFNSQSSAFLGNHRNHLSAAPDTASCGICHTPVAPTGFGHQNGIIGMANSLKGYSAVALRAKYDKGIFFNLTSIPNLTNARCSNVNCHFEKQTPVWGSTAYVSPADCNGCHGAPPAGTPVAPSGGLAGSHTRHDVYYPGAANCQKCHPGYATFTHATTAGRPLKVQGFLRNPLSALESGASYSGSGLNYLPGKSGAQLFGTCANLYCHSSGQNATSGSSGVVYNNPVWGSAALTCAGCHVDEATDTVGTGSHRVHTISTGAGLDCSVCHLGYTKATVSTTTHVNSLIELGASGFTYSQGSGATNPAANGYGTCSASLCHGSSATVTWGANSSNATCTKCHGKGTIPANYSTASAVQSAPGYAGTGTDLAGQTGVITNSVSNDPQVGAHDAHLRTVNNYTARVVLCSDCHTVPASGAHANGTTDLVWSNLARNIGTSGTPASRGTLAPTYSAGVCSANYCHGGRLAGGINTSPAWTGTTYLTTYAKTAANCGQCHGAPPLSAPSSYLHAGLTIGSDCAGCHGHNGNGPTHIDGTLQAAGGSCNSCHDYDTTAGGTTWGTTNFGKTVAMEGRGAHAKHIEYIKARYRVTLNPASDTFGSGNAAVVCGVCHTNLVANHTMSDSTQPRSINFGDGSLVYKFGNTNPLYNGAYNTSSAVYPKSCSNLDCHYKTSPVWSKY